jgi:hypothetical protein
MDWFWSTGPFWFALFLVSMFFNARAAFKLLLDWKGMLTTCRFIEDEYAALDRLPTEVALEHQPGAPVFVHLVPAFYEPGIAETLTALLASRYPHGRLHVIVATREEEERAPHPSMPATTAELVRRYREALPPWQQKMLTLVVGVSDADSLPDPNVYRWIAADVLAGRGRTAYQGVTLSLANFERLGQRGRVCAIQQSSIFIRVSIARLINEVRRVTWFGRFRARWPRLAALVRPVFELGFRRSQICLGHNTFLRLDLLASLDGFPTSGATEDSTLGYALGARGVLIGALPMVELVDLPETTDKLVRQNARWYKGVLDDVRFLVRQWRSAPTAFNFAQLARHIGNKVVEWPIAAIVYPVVGFMGWHLAYRFSDYPVMFVLGIAFPSISLGLTIWVGGIVTQDLIESLAPYFPRPVNIARTSLLAKFWGTFRCQTYWLLATRGAWRVLLALGRTGRFEPAKTDRVAA